MVSFRTRRPGIVLFILWSWIRSQERSSRIRDIFNMTAKVTREGGDAIADLEFAAPTRDSTRMGRVPARTDLLFFAVQAHSWQPEPDATRSGDYHTYCRYRTVSDYLLIA